MIAILNNQALAVTRQIKNVVWCPHCDRSRQAGTVPVCRGCGAQFEEGEIVTPEVTPEPQVTEEETEEDAPAPRRRRSSST